jgi:hypothetical protein
MSSILLQYYRNTLFVWLPRDLSEREPVDDYAANRDLEFNAKTCGAIPALGTILKMALAHRAGVSSHRDTPEMIVVVCRATEERQPNYSPDAFFAASTSLARRTSLRKPRASAGGATRPVNRAVLECGSP